MLKTLGRETKGFRLVSVLTPIFMIAEVIMEMIIPKLMASIIDNGVTPGNMQVIYTVGAQMVVAALFAAIGLLKDKKGKISVQFVLEGDINDPRFSLNEQFASRLGTSLAGTLGISIESLAKGVGSVGGGAAKSIGESLGKLLGK